MFATVKNLLRDNICNSILLISDLSIYYNPSAGSGRAEKVWKAVQALLDARGVKYALLERDKLDKAHKDVIVIGGDGTFNTLLNGLSKPEEHRFVLLAGGTSNSLYSQISGKENAINKVQRYLDDAPFLRTDLPELTCNGQTWRFINEASAGFAASISQMIESRSTKKRFNQLGLNELAYIATAFRCWRREEPVMVSFCNNKRISGDLYPCPGAKLDDGLIDVFELRCPRLRLPLELTRLIRAKNDVASKWTKRKQISTGKWLFDTPLPVEIDGNPIGKTSEIELHLYSASIEVL